MRVLHNSARSQLNAFGLGYQIGYLLLPTLGPVLVWLWLERKFMKTVMLEATLSNAAGKAEDGVSGS